MLVVLPVAEREIDAARKLLGWVRDLGPMPAHRLLIAVANPVDTDIAKELADAVHEVFAGTTIIRQAVRDERPWPANANALFRSASEYVKERLHEDFLWLECDAIPVCPNWLDAIESEYRSKGKPFMGAFFERPVPHMNGVMVWPAKLNKIHPWSMTANGKPFDLTRADVILSMAHKTDLIVRSLSEWRTNTPHTFPDSASLSLIPQGCVLFHGCKDGTLIDRLREQRGLPATGEAMPVGGDIIVRRTGAIGDALAATCVTTKLQQKGFKVVFQTAPLCQQVLRHMPGLTLSAVAGNPDVNLDGAYENDADRCQKSFAEMFVDSANAQLKARKTVIEALNVAPSLEWPTKGRKRFIRRFDDMPRPWVAIIPRSNSFAARTVPDETWGKAAPMIPGTKFWFGTHGPAPEAIVDLHVREINECVIACSAMDLVICVDTGPMHIAAALGIQVLAIEQSSSPELHLSDQRDYEVIRPPHLGCLNCQKLECPINREHPPCQDIAPCEIASAAIRKLRTKLGSAVVSCVIPVFRPTAERLNTCLKAVIGQVEEVIVCRGQAGIFPKGAMDHPKIRYIAGRHGDVGYGRNMNFGMRHTNGNWVLALTDDVYLQGDAVSKLMEIGSRDPKIAAIGHLLWYPGMKEIQHGGTTRKSGDVGWGHIDHRKSMPSITEPLEVENVTGASVMYRREAFYDVLGFDERYYLYMEDNDINLRLRKKGWQIWYTPHAVAVHDEHASTKATAGIAQHVAHSHAVFKELWGGYFKHNYNNTFGNFNYT